MARTINLNADPQLVRIYGDLGYLEEAERERIMALSKFQRDYEIPRVVKEVADAKKNSKRRW